MEKAPCKDCGTNTFIGDNYYMVTTEIWNTYGLGGSIDTPGGGWTNTDDFNESNEGFLCVGCLEERMGRKITREDLRDCLASSTNPRFKNLFYH